MISLMARGYGKTYGRTIFRQTSSPICLITPELISVLPKYFPWHAPNYQSLVGHHGTSRYDKDVALYAAMAGVVMGLEQLRVRRTYDLTQRATHFTSEDAARTWTQERVRITIIAAYTAMVELTREAVSFVKDHVMFSENDLTEICCMSADAVQGETFDYMVLALPPSTSEWSEWLCEPSRLLTIISRYKLQLAIIYVFEEGVSPYAHGDSKHSIKAVLDLQQRAWTQWTWKFLVESMGWSLDNSTQPVSYTHLTLPTTKQV